MEILTHLLPEADSSRLVLAWNRVKEHESEAILTSDERREHHGFKNAARKSEFIATRRLVQNMANKMDLDPAHFLLQKDDYGKPFALYEEKEYKVSIAHTLGRVLCAISPEIELGVDMEPEHRQVPNRLRNRLLNPNEVSLLKNEETIRIWTVKEAMVKLQGKGMRTNLNECTIESAADNEFIAIFNDDKKAKICSFVHENHWLAIARNIK